MKILIDTDIGSDIDDALCLSLLLRHPEAEIIGITTVSGMAETRAKLVYKFTQFYGKETILIVPGIDEPLSGKQLQPEVPQAKILNTWPHKRIFDRTDVVEFLAECIDSYPDEIVLLSIGPLTNIAELVKRHPETARRVRKFVTMGGRFATGTVFSDVPEWNILCDIQAAQEVYNCGLFRQMICVGSDVTRQLAMRVEEAIDRLADTGMTPVRDMADIWFNGRVKMTFHDPLAAAILFNPDLCTYKQGNAEINSLTGTTYWSDIQNGPLTVTDTVDSSAFFKYFFSYV